MSTMLNSNQEIKLSYDRDPETSHTMMEIVPNDPASRGAVYVNAQASIGKGLIFQGDITGTEPLFIDGKAEGSINLPGSRVTVGRNGNVEADISAREIVIMGKVHGNVKASDRVEVRAEGGVTGDVSATRVSIEDGAFFKGGIYIQKVEPKPVRSFGSALATVKELKEA